MHNSEQEESKLVEEQSLYRSLYLCIVEEQSLYRSLYLCIVEEQSLYRSIDR